MPINSASAAHHGRIGPEQPPAAPAGSPRRCQIRSRRTATARPARATCGSPRQTSRRGLDHHGPRSSAGDLPGGGSRPEHGKSVLPVLGRPNSADDPGGDNEAGEEGVIGCYVIDLGVVLIHGDSPRSRSLTTSSGVRRFPVAESMTGRPPHIVEQATMG